MVQKDTRRRSSLILGILLALLLGVAVGLFVLAVPVRMLETVTTFTRLSKLMVQAEPPISPSDRSLLAVLAGILTSGVGWVLVDWSLFGRAGLNRLIKPREDEYEDEDGDSFRPTDPLDLVSPVSLPVPEWTPSPAGDARRPLSARTDIGDPPKPAMPFGGGEPPLNPFGQILPGVGGSAPPLQPVVPPLGQQPAGGVWGSPNPNQHVAGAPPAASWPPLDLTTGVPGPQAGAPEQNAPAPTGWLPVPGARPDGGQPSFEGGDPANAAAPAEPQPAAIPPLPIPPALTPAPQNEAAPPLPVFPAPRETFAAPPLEPLTPPPFAAEPPAAPVPFITPVLTPVEPAPVAPDPVAFPIAAPTPAPARAPAPARGPSESGFDKARLEELLVRLERGLERRRAAAAAAATAASAPVEPVAPVAAPVPPPAAAPTPAPAFQPEASAAPVEPPIAYAARMPDVPPAIPAYTPPPAEPAPVFTIAPSIPQPPAPEPTPVAAPAIMPQPPEIAARNDGMLDQPLHVTLDLLRSMVKR